MKPRNEVTTLGALPTGDSIAQRGGNWSATGRSQKPYDRMKTRVHMCHACAETVPVLLRLGAWAGETRTCAGCGETMSLGMIIGPSI